jgi:hypothetical protein
LAAGAPRWSSGGPTRQASNRPTTCNPICSDSHVRVRAYTESATRWRIKILHIPPTCPNAITLTEHGGANPAPEKSFCKDWNKAYMQQPCLPTAQRRVRSPAGHHARPGHRRGHPGGRTGCDGEHGPTGRRDEAPLAPEWRFCSCSWALGPPRGRAQNWARNRPRRAVKGARGHPRGPLGRLGPWRAFIQRSTLTPKTTPKPQTP